MRPVYRLEPDCLPVIADLILPGSHMPADEFAISACWIQRDKWSIADATIPLTKNLADLDTAAQLTFDFNGPVGCRATSARSRA
jgi:hypothetical protein